MSDRVTDISNREKPRILIFSIAYDPLVGGAELAVRNITDRLLQYEFDLITLRFDPVHPPRETIGNVRVFRVGFGSRLGRYLFPWFAARLAKKLHRQNPYQLVWAIMAAYAGAAALLFLRGNSGIKFLLTLQEGDPIEHIRRRVRFFYAQWRKVFLRADYIQTISKFLADWAREEGARCPIVVVPNGVDLQLFENQSVRAAVKSSENLVVTVSRLVPKNGVDLLIRAAGQLRATDSDLRFRVQILGVGPEEQRLRALARKLGVERQVEFLGSIAPQHLPRYLSRAAVFARPSRSEGLGSAFLEAMAAGVPVIGTPVGGIPEFLVDGQTGLLSQPEDPADLARKLKLLLIDPGLRERLGAAGQRLVTQRYDWNQISSQMENIFNILAVK